jgi:hypothetical protein
MCPSLRHNSHQHLIPFPERFFNAHFLLPNPRPFALFAHCIFADQLARWSGCSVRASMWEQFQPDSNRGNKHSPLVAVWLRNPRGTPVDIHTRMASHENKLLQGPRHAAMICPSNAKPATAILPLTASPPAATLPMAASPASATFPRADAGETDMLPTENAPLNERCPTAHRTPVATGPTSIGPHAGVDRRVAGSRASPVRW